MSDQKIRLGGLWRSRSKSGVEYLTGLLGQARLLIFKNDRKSEEKSPDYTMFIVSNERETGSRKESLTEEIPF